MNDELMYWRAGSIGPVCLDQYPDGMPLIRCDHGYIDRLLLRPSSLGSFMTAMFFMDALGDRAEQIPTLILPCVPGGRQDRLTRAGDYLFTAKSVAKELNARPFTRVTMLDPHSDVMPALVNRSRVITAADCINPPPNKYRAVVSPDAGAENRALAVAKKLGVPLLHGWKQRDVHTGALCGFGLQPHGLPKDSLVLVVDDLCDGGGTFLGLADVLDEAGLKAHLWVTHGLFSQGTDRLLKRYGHVYCTDSVLGPRKGIIEIPVCKSLLENGTVT